MAEIRHGHPFWATEAAVGGICSSGRLSFLIATASLSTSIIVVLSLSEIADGDDGKGGAN